MENNEIKGFLAAYRQGVTADFLQPKLAGQWGALWTLPPCDPRAAERAGRQMARMGATEVRWVRRAELRCAWSTVDVMIVTELPEQTQAVVGLESGEEVKVSAYFEDQTARSITSCFLRSATEP